MRSLGPSSFDDIPEDEKRKARKAAWCVLNREKVNKRRRKLRAEDPEKYREIKRKWSGANRERVNEGKRRREAAGASEKWRAACARRLRKWKDENPELARIRERGRYARHRDKSMAAARKWYAANRERALDRARMRVAADPQKERERLRKWRGANREKVRENRRRGRAAKKSRITDAQWTEILSVKVTKRRAA